MRYQIETMFASKYQITLKESLFGSSNMLSLFVHILDGETKINDFNFVQVIFVVSQIWGITYQYVVQFYVIKSVASLVN